MRRRGSIARIEPAPETVAAELSRTDADLLVRVVGVRNAAGFPIAGFDDWVRFHLRRDAAALGVPVRRRDERGRFLPAGGPR